MLIQKDKKTTIISQLLLTILAIIFLLPVIVMFKISFQGRGFENYLKVIRLEYVYQFFFNSILISIFTVVLVYFISLLTAYSLSKKFLKINTANGITPAVIGKIIAK